MKAIAVPAFLNAMLHFHPSHAKIFIIFYFKLSIRLKMCVCATKQEQQVHSADSLSRWWGRVSFEGGFSPCGEIDNPACCLSITLHSRTRRTSAGYAGSRTYAPSRLITRDALYSPGSGCSIRWECFVPELAVLVEAEVWPDGCDSRGLFGFSVSRWLYCT
jgi:hypothetical protein